MRLINIADQEVAKRIKEGKHEVLVLLFERNLVNSLNLGIKLNISEKEIHTHLAMAVVMVWQYFSAKPWLASKHKIDFIIDYLLKKTLQKEFKELVLKNKYNFSEFDIILTTFFQSSEEPNEPLINNFKVLADAEKSSLWLSFFEKKTEEEIAESLGKTEEKIRKLKKKAFLKWVSFLCLNQKYPIDKDAIALNIEEFLDYNSGGLSKEKMLGFEMQLSVDKPFSKLYAGFVILTEEIRVYRRNSLVKFILKNASTKLTGNVWGNKISIASAIFIVLMGLLLWYSKQVKHKNGQSEIQNIDSLKNPSE